MTEDVARAVAAEGATTVTIGGKECTARALLVREMAEAERICLEGYKRGYIKTVSDNADLVDRRKRDGLIERAVLNAAKWTVLDLPPVPMHVPQRIKVTDKLEAWLIKACGAGRGDSKDRLKTVAASALDEKMLSPELYEELTGDVPPTIRIGYANWWITETLEGKIAMVWLCFRDNGVTREEVADELGRNPGVLAAMVREVEALSVPQAGNG